MHSLFSNACHSVTKITLIKTKINLFTYSYCWPENLSKMVVAARLHSFDFSSRIVYVQLDVLGVLVNT